MWRLGTGTLALARLRPAGLIAFFMAVTCDSASGKQGGKPLAENLGTFFLSKAYSALYKVFSSLPKVRAQNKDTLSLRGREMPRSGTSSTLSKATASHRQG